MTPTRDDLVALLDALDRARGQVVAVLRAPDAAPEVRARVWRRVAGEVRVLHYEERRDRVSEEGRYRHE